MQRLITEDSANPLRVEAAMTVTTYGRRMASTLAAIAEARTRRLARDSAECNDAAHRIARLNDRVARRNVLRAAAGEHGDGAGVCTNR